MSELGDQFLLTLADQGYGLAVTTEDVIILMSNRRDRWAVPKDLLEEPTLEPMLRLAIANFAAVDGRFVWPPESDYGRG